MKEEKSYTRNKDEKIKLIFKAFAELIIEKGFENVTIRDITNRAKIGIGTVYRYFPKGKASIASGFFQHTSDKIFDLNALKKIGSKNLPKIFELYIRNHLKTHRDNYEIHRAYDQAILTNRSEFEDTEEIIATMFKNILKIYKKEKLFAEIPESVLFKNMIIIFNLLEAIVHRHLFIVPFFESDEELVEFILKIVLFLIQN